LLVLPSHSENFGFVVAEALSAGVPAIVTRGAPWQELETRRCGWWIDISVESLARCLREALAADPSELRAMGARGREWIIRELSWSRVAEMMELTYSWMLGRTDRPTWVHLD
jgi:glycosyltransferase involved in cell wall biosynthesis